MTTNVFEIDGKIMVTRYSLGSGKGIAYQINVDYMGATISDEEFISLTEAMVSEVLEKHEEKVIPFGKKSGVD